MEFDGTTLSKQTRDHASVMRQITGELPPFLLHPPWEFKTGVISESGWESVPNEMGGEEGLSKGDFRIAAWGRSHPL